MRTSRLTRINGKEEVDDTVPEIGVECLATIDCDKCCSLKCAIQKTRGDIDSDTDVEYVVQMEDDESQDGWIVQSKVY
jgi:hypothetical protein